MSVMFEWYVMERDDIEAESVRLKDALREASNQIGGMMGTALQCSDLMEHHKANCEKLVGEQKALDERKQNLVAWRKSALARLEGE